MKTLISTSNQQLDQSIRSIIPPAAHSQRHYLRMPLLSPDPRGRYEYIKSERQASRPKLLFFVPALLGFSLLTFLLFFARGTQLRAAFHNSKDPELISDEYGTNARPPFTDMIQVKDLPSDLIPETGKHRHGGRLVVVGDVHGMKDSLVELLDKIGFNKKHDHLILAGDMVSKGPDSAGVVDLAMKLGATGIRGNHEDRIILAHSDMVKEHADTQTTGPNEDPAKTVDDMEELSFSHGDYKDRSLVRKLGHKRMKWLKDCPVILRVGKLGSMGEVVVVHGGLAPGVKLERQDPSVVMNMRTIGKGDVPSDEHDGKPWAKAWNKHQKKLPKSHRTTVIYGHDSKRGLQNKKYSIGIDTGCLKGGKLTAVVIGGGSSDHTHKLVHVKCKDGRGR